MSVPEKLIPQFDFLQSKLEMRTETFRKNSDACWQITFYFRIAAFGLSALITALAGWHAIKPDPEQAVYMRNALLVLGAFSTFLASTSAFWNLERYFLENRVIYEGLKRLRDHAKYVKLRATEVTEGELDGLWNELERILSKRAQYWTDAYESAHASDRTRSSAKSGPSKA